MTQQVDLIGGVCVPLYLDLNLTLPVVYNKKAWLDKNITEYVILIVKERNIYRDFRQRG